MLVILVGVLNYAVNFFLLMATSRLKNQPVCLLRIAFAALAGGIYGGFCLLPGCSFLATATIRITMLWCMCLIAWGIGKNAAYNGLVFILFHLAITGIATAKQKGALAIIPTVASVVILCFVLLRGGHKNQILPVELCYKDRKVSFYALQDTGNGLKDPLTGQSVLVLDSKISQQLTGLQLSQLQDPISTIQTNKFPGMRLIPYQSLGNPHGFLLGMRFQNARIGSWKGSLLVAFAPDVFRSDGKFQALAGGSV